MKNIKIELPCKVNKIITTLQQHGYEAYAVGGCVRDSILGRVPGDWDITTSAMPEETKALFHKTFDTGIEHGTVTVLLEKEGFEVTTYRIDGKYEDNRHPAEVTFTRSLEEDLLRRDFTINAMAYNDEEGLIDPFNGMEDIKYKKISCVGCAEDRFGEDALRILRSLRFAAQLAFKIEEKTEAAIFKNFPLLNNISLERKRDEFLKIIQAPKGAEILQKYYPVFNFVRLRQAFDYPFADYQEILAYILTDADFELRLSKKDNALIRELIACRTIDISDDKALINALSSPEQKRILDFLGAINQQDLTERVEMLRPYIVTPTSLAISNQELLAHGYQGSAISKKKQELIAMIRQQKLRNDNSELRKVL